MSTPAAPETKQQPASPHNPESGAAESTLLAAAERGDVSAVRHGIEAAAGVEVQFRALNLAGVRAAEAGRQGVLEFCLDREAELGGGAPDEYEDYLCVAAECGRLDLLRWLHGRGATNFGGAISTAAAHGQEAAFMLCRELGGASTDGALDAAIEAAAEGGHLAMVQRCLDWGATNFDGARECALAAGQTAVLALLEAALKED